MKPGKGLAPGKPLERSAMKKTPPSKTQKRRATRARAEKRERAGEHPFTWTEVRGIIFARCGGRCEGCGKAITLGTMEGHHRRTRSVGPDCPGNALALCRDCHHGPTVHGGPELARELGRIVSKFSDVAPCDHPVVVHGRGLVLLDCLGGFTPVPDEG